MAAFYAVGSRKQIDLFQLSLMVIASLCAFRTVRDAWFAAIPAILLLADVSVEPTDQDPAFTPWQLLSLTGSTAVLVFLLATNTGFTVRGVDYCVSLDGRGAGPARVRKCKTFDTEAGLGHFPAACTDLPPWRTRCKCHWIIWARR